MLLQESNKQHDGMMQPSGKWITVITLKLIICPISDLFLLYLPTIFLFKEIRCHTFYLLILIEFSEKGYQLGYNSFVTTYSFCIRHITEAL